MIKTEIYRHKNNIYAFGMYAQERAPDYNFVKIGVQGYAENTLVNFVKGQYYVKVICNYGDKSTGPVLLKLAKLIEENLKGTNKLPEMFSRFPEQKKVRNSERYVATEFLGYAFMPGVYVTSYNGINGPNRLFIIDAGSIDKASELIGKLKKKSESSKKKKGMLILQDKYNGKIYLTQMNDLVYGCVDKFDPGLFKSFTGKYQRGLWRSGSSSSNRNVLGACKSYWNSLVLRRRKTMCRVVVCELQFAKQS